MDSTSLQKNKPQEKAAEQPASPMKKYVWKVGFIFVLAIGAVLFNKVYIFQTHPEFEGIRQGNLSEILYYGLPFAVVFILFDLYIHYLLDDWCYKNFITEERYIEPEARKKRSYTLVKWGYSIIYYIISSVWCYKILCGTRFMPTWLGGLGSPYILATQGPKVLDVTFEMKVFYICQFGKHFARFFGHLFIRPQGSFFEYALHHGLSVFLIVFSYLTNQWLIGLFVLLIHDYSDFGLILGRAYKDYRYMSKKFLDFTYVHGFIAWFVCRIFLFMAVCIYPAYYTAKSFLNDHAVFTEFQYDVLKLTYWFMIVMMLGLYVLHIFWTYYLVEAFIAVKMPAKAVRHTYD